jgi:hypothetical protein
MIESGVDMIRLGRAFRTDQPLIETSPVTKSRE